MSRKTLPQIPSKTCSVYVRLSREAAEENLSKEGMVDDCRLLAESLGLIVIAVHVDDGISGSVRNRPEFLAWLADAADGRAGTLIAWHVDRLTREGVNVAAAILDTIEGKDPLTGRVVRSPVRLLDTKGLDSQTDETAFRFQFVIKAEVARAERERMRDRSRAAYQRLRAAGRWTGGPPPFGFRAVENPDGPGKVLEIAPEEAQALSEAASQILAGEKLIKVVRWMNSPAGHPPRRAKEWQQTTLLQSLTGGPIGGKLGEGGTCPAIVTADEAAALRAVLAVKDPNPYKGRQPARLLSGLLRCASCLAVLQVARRSRGLPMYRCPTRRLSGSCPRSVSISARAVEAHISGLFLAAWGDSPEYVRRAEVTGAAAVEAAEMRKAEALVRLGTSPTPEAFQALQDAQAALDEALTIPQEAIVRVVPSGRTVREAWDVGDVHARRDLLSANYARILVRPGTRGRPGIQPERLAVVAHPPHVLSNTPEVFRLGGVAVGE